MANKEGYINYNNEQNKYNFNRNQVNFNSNQPSFGNHQNFEQVSENSIDSNKTPAFKENTTKSKFQQQQSQEHFNSSKIYRVITPNKGLNSKSQLSINFYKLVSLVVYNKLLLISLLIIMFIYFYFMLISIQSELRFYFYLVLLVIYSGVIIHLVLGEVKYFIVHLLSIKENTKNFFYSIFYKQINKIDKYDKHSTNEILDKTENDKVYQTMQKINNIRSNLHQGSNYDNRGSENTVNFRPIQNQDLSLNKLDWQTYNNNQNSKIRESRDHSSLNIHSRIKAREDRSFAATIKTDFPRNLSSSLSHYDNNNTYRNNLTHQNATTNSMNNNISNDYNKFKRNINLLNKLLYEIFNNPNYKTKLELLTNNNIVENNPILSIGNSMIFHQDLQEIGFSYDILSTVSNLKLSIIQNILPNIIDYHSNNLTNINKLLSVFGLSLSENLEQCSIEKTNVIILEMLSKNKFNLLNLNLNKNSIDYDGKLQKNENEFPDNTKFFWGDSPTIKALLISMNDKYKELEKIVGSKIEFKGKEDFKFNDNTNNEIKSQYTKEQDNMFLKKEYNPITSNTMYSSIQKKEENIKLIKNLVELLDMRININNILLGEYIGLTDSKAILILLDYNLKRLNYLNSTKLIPYNHCGGGEYNGSSWNNFFPTDAILLANIIVENIKLTISGKAKTTNFYDQNYFLCEFLKRDRKINLNTNQKLFLNRPFPDDKETYYNVVYKNKVIRTIKVSFLIIL